MFTRTSQVNSVAFTPDEVEKNLHMDLINFLLSYNSKADDSFFDIHITTDGYCTIVEFVSLTRGVNDNSEGFAYVDEEHYVLKRVEFPDGHYEYLDDEVAEEALKEWLANNPGWEKDEHGYWWYHKPKEENENEFNDDDFAADDQAYYKFVDADGDRDGDREISKQDLTDLSSHEINKEDLDKLGNHLNNVEKTLRINKKENSEIK